MWLLFAFLACTPKPVDVDKDGYTADVDCDDADPAVHPNADEACNVKDDDCDSTVDEDAVDVKSDGQCHDSCDTDPDIWNGAPEICDAKDNDCDGSVDEDATDAETWYPDVDVDAYGDPNAPVLACTCPPGDVGLLSATDCDDTDETIHPGADELCNGTDDDCDLIVDEDPSDGKIWYPDQDGDAYGSDAGTLRCEGLSGEVLSSGDCNDVNADIHPGADEVCNVTDDDCDTTVDEDPTDGETFYADSDGDSYGDPSKTTTGCEPPSGYVSNKTDCDDKQKKVNPGASDICNSVDDDCDGLVDEGGCGSTT